ncbi:MAG: HPr family phosphocarrier protein [Gammaproteobacteria bacterium]|nr:HPr family phosphocarrier protein [Gammaproteobacteria bacterium]
MLEKDITIVNKLGLHARAAAKFVGLASEFNSDIVLAHDGRKVNGKSIMGVMMLAAAKGMTIQLSARGEDEVEALACLEELIRQRFGEEN